MNKNYQTKSKSTELQRLKGFPAPTDPENVRYINLKTESSKGATNNSKNVDYDDDWGNLETT